MSQIKTSQLLLSALLALALGGCGDKNGKAVFSPEGGHPSGWVTSHRISAGANIESCAECHGERYNGGISKVSCMSQSAVGAFTCHATTPVANQSGCLSCHGGLPNGPFGSAAPNRQSAHTRHIALSGVVCDTCHANAGSGTAGHARAAVGGGFSKATVAIPVAFRVYSASGAHGVFGYNSDNGKCSSVSCHGGKITPAWTGSINIIAGDNSICISCHEPGSSAAKPQYNSYYSGMHSYHLGSAVNANCTDCHNISTLVDFQKHFAGISANTVVMPRQTVGNGAPTKITTYSATKTCLGACHTTETFPWGDMD